MDDDAMIFTVDLRSISTEIFQEVDALLAEIEREREQGGPQFTGGIVHQSPDELAHLIVDGVVSRHLAEALGARTSATTPSSSAGSIFLETRWTPPPSYEEVQEVDRVLARRARPRATGR